VARAAAAILLGWTFVLAPTSSATSRGTSYFHVGIAISGKGAVRFGPEFLARGSVRCPSFDPEKLVCPGDELWTVNGTRATVTAVPAAGWRLLSWHGACAGTDPVCVVKNPGRDAHVQAVFVATVPGLTRALPVPLGTTATIADGWRVKVISVIPNAKLNMPAPAGAEDFMALVKLTYIGGGKGNTTPLYNNLETIGLHNATYPPSCGGAKLPNPVLSYAGTDVFSGGSVTGHICWQIARNDAVSLVLFIGSGFTHTTWFALSRRR
jgi:hypothetical protein